VKAHQLQSLPNFLIQECFDDFRAPWARELFDGVPRMVDGYLEASDRPGIGVELDERACAAHPYGENNFLRLFEDGWEMRRNYLPFTPRDEIAVRPVRRIAACRATVPWNRSSHDLVAQHSKSFHLELHHVAALEQLAALGARPIANGARAEQLAGSQFLGQRGVRDHVGDLPVNRARARIALYVAVDPRDHVRVVHIRNLVRSHQAGPEHVATGEVFAFGRPKADRHLAALDCAPAEIVVDRVAEDMLHRPPARNIRTAYADHEGQLELEI